MDYPQYTANLSHTHASIDNSPPTIQALHLCDARTAARLELALEIARLTRLGILDAVVAFMTEDEYWRASDVLYGGAE